MKYYHLVIVAHSLTLLILFGLLIIILKKNKKTLVDHSLGILVFSFAAWIFFDLLSQVTAFMYKPFDLIGTIAGISVQLLALSVLFFCEVFPDSVLTKFAKIRISIITITSFVMASFTFSPKWISNRRIENEIYKADLGIYFYIISIYAIVIILLAFSILGIKYFKTNKNSDKKSIRLFLLGAIISLIIVVIFSFIFPAIGLPKYFFIGPDACLVFISFIAYSILYQQMFDLKSEALRLTIKIVLNGIIGAIISFIGLKIFIILGLYNQVLVTWMLFAIFFIGVGFGMLVIPKIDSILFPAYQKAESGILSFLNELNYADYQKSYENFLFKLLEIIHLKAPIKKSFFLSIDRVGNVHFINSGENSYIYNEIDFNIFILLSKLNSWKKLIIKEVDNIYLLNDKTFNLLKESEFYKQHRHVATRFIKSLQFLKRSGFEIFMPLFHRQVISGYLVLGEKLDSLPYYDKDIEIWKKIKFSLALSLRNHLFYDEILSYRDRAEFEAEKLSELIASASVVHKDLEGKTLIYKSAVMEKVVGQVKQSANSKKPILIYGETGTGKELIARLIHDYSDEKLPFEAINCAATPESLWEDEIFGHIKGAFTDASRDRKGKVELAGNGILFFDEISEMPLTIQAKMLRLLQENIFTPLGGVKQLKSNCRFIFATNKDLWELSKEKKFREDLFYRINVFQIEIPPLRKRIDDVPALVDHYFKLYSKEMKMDIQGVSDAVLNIFINYTWPGNIRELENIILRSIAGCQSNMLSLNDLPEFFREKSTLKKFATNKFISGKIAAGVKSNNSAHALDAQISLAGNFEDKVKAYQRSLIERAISLSGGNKSKAAEMLGIKRGKLLYQLKELKINM